MQDACPSKQCKYSSVHHMRRPAGEHTVVGSARREAAARDETTHALELGAKYRPSRGLRRGSLLHHLYDTSLPLS